jgi:Domain of unknown function (DUF1707)
MSPADPTLRASDAERERTAEALRAHFAAGRISDDELDERTDAAYAARTVGELQALLSDLPSLPAPPPRPGHDPERELAKRRVLQRTGTWALFSVAAIAIWLATGASGTFWPIWLVLGAGIRLAMVSWSELGPGAAERRRLGRGSAARPRHGRPAPPLPPTSPQPPGEQAQEPQDQR